MKNDHCISLKWNLIYIPIVLAVLVVGILGYGSMPDVVATHFDFEGNPDSFSQKGPGLIAFPVVLAAFFAGIMTSVHAIINHFSSADPSNPDAIAASRSQALCLLVIGIPLTAVVGLMVQLMVTGAVDAKAATIAITCVAVACIVAGIVVLFVSGKDARSAKAQDKPRGGASSRTSAQTSPSPASQNDSAHWKAGFIYKNPDDARIFVPMPNNMGTTFNFGQKKSWLVLAALIVVPIVFIVICVALVS